MRLSIIILAVIVMVASATALTPEEGIAEFEKCVDASTTALQRYFETEASKASIKACQGELFFALSNK